MPVSLKVFLVLVSPTNSFGNSFFIIFLTYNSLKLKVTPVIAQISPDYKTNWAEYGFIAKRARFDDTRCVERETQP